jgi:hypothetical protein
MNRLREEMRVIPSLAWATAVVGAVIVPIIIILYLFVKEPTRETGWVLFVALIAVGIMLMFFVYILILGYIAGDARRRGMRPVLWTLLAIFIPNAIGIILYFILREPLLQSCPKCGTGSKAMFTFCPACGEALTKMCPACQGAIQPGWSHCAKCGAQLTAVPSGPSRDDPLPHGSMPR